MLLPVFCLNSVYICFEKHAKIYYQDGFLYHLLGMKIVLNRAMELLRYYLDNASLENIKVSFKLSISDLKHPRSRVELAKAIKFLQSSP